MADERDASGRSDGLAELYRRHAPGGFRLAFLLTGSRAAAEDLLHDAFVRVAGRFRHLRFPEAFDPYLRSTIVNLHISQLRKQRSERIYVERERRRDPDVQVLPDVAGRDELWEALMALPPRQRAAVVLRFYEDLSERQAAEVMGSSLEALRSAVARGMRTLRSAIGGEIDDRPRS
jgi:RNA polymerase sigma-70 factor (sigma-E family)